MPLAMLFMQVFEECISDRLRSLLDQTHSLQVCWCEGGFHHTCVVFRGVGRIWQLCLFVFLE